MCNVVRWRERCVRGPCVHDSLDSDALGFGQADGDPHGHDFQPAGKEEEDGILHGAEHLIEALADDEAGNELDEHLATHAGRAGLVGVDLRRHLQKHQPSG